MKIDLKELGKRIKLTRKGQDLTQEMLAEKAGVSQHYIYEIEAGRKAMSIHSFASLTTALDVSADYPLLVMGKEYLMLIPRLITIINYFTISTMHIQITYFH